MGIGQILTRDLKTRRVWSASWGNVNGEVGNPRAESDPRGGSDPRAGAMCKHGIGRLRGARSTSSFCDFRKMAFRDLNTFFSFLTRENLVFFRYSY